MTTATRKHIQPQATSADQDNDDYEYNDGDELPDVPQPYELPTQSLELFLKRHHEQIRRLLIENFQPTYDPTQDHRPLPPLRRPPLGAQELAIRATAHRLENNGNACIVGEMGIGKTFCAIAAATACKDIRRIIVLVPPHLTTKWKREVEITLPSRSVHTEIVHSLKQLQRLERRFGPAGTDRRILFVIMSHWQAKTSHYWRPAHNAITGRGILTMRSPKDPGPRPHLPACPDCGTPVTDEQRIERLEAIKPKYKLRCEGMRTDAEGQLYTCDAPLWSADNRNPLRIVDRPGGKRRTVPTRPNPGNDRRAALSDYIGKHMRGFFDLTIADELHQYKAKGSARGISAGNIAAATKRSLTLTGTLMGGQSTTIFYLLHRFSPEFRNNYGFNDTAQWRARYGFTETNTTWKEEADSEKGLQGAQSKRKDTKITIKELPGITPNALFHIIAHTIFIKLRDVSNELPPYDEHVSIIPMSENKADGDSDSQHSNYQILQATMKKELVKALNQGSSRLLGAYLQSLLSYPDACTHGETVKDPLTKRTLISIKPISGDVIYPKEQKLLEIVAEEKAIGRKVLVYTKHVDKRDITRRLQSLLTNAGHRTLVMRTGNPTTENRESWIDKNTPLCDVMITNPSLVETGLDLIHYPTIVWYEPDYSVFTVRQASRRSWRIGQKNPVRVHHLVYANCMQTQALKHIALKAQTSLAIEGEIPQQGLTEYSGGSHDMTMHLAKQLLGQIPDDGLSVLEAMQMARAQESADDQVLTDHEYTLPIYHQTLTVPLERSPLQQADTSHLNPGQQISMEDFLFADN